VAVGAEDRVTPVEVSGEICGAIAGARLSILEGFGHLSKIEAPECVVRPIRDH
jgi:pimeloyl-ACP methyl ester carboxylesterase